MSCTGSAISSLQVFEPKATEHVATQAKSPQLMTRTRSRPEASIITKPETTNASTAHCTALPWHCLTRAHGAGKRSECAQSART